MPERPSQDALAPRVLFVGAFAHEGTGHVAGGQAYACTTLVEGPLRHRYTWRLLDTPHRGPGAVRRVAGAVGRLVTFAGHVLTRRVDMVLLFSASGASFVEKGTMALLGGACGLPVIFAPRSGLLLDTLDRSAGLRRFARVVFGRCTALLCQSEGWRRYYQDLTGLPDARFAVVPNWIAAGPYAELPPPVPRPHLHLLYLGRLEPYKGILDLLDALDRLPAEVRSRVRCRVCGDGSLASEVQDRIHALGLEAVVTLEGWVDGAEKMAALTDADVLVLPSHREGLPNAVLEAMAAGRAVVATTVGGVPEIIDDGRTGRLIPPGDPACLADVLAALDADRATVARLGGAAQAYVRAERTIEGASETLDALFTRCLAPALRAPGLLS